MASRLPKRSRCVWQPPCGPKTCSCVLTGSHAAVWTRRHARRDACCGTGEGRCRRRHRRAASRRQRLRGAPCFAAVPDAMPPAPSASLTAVQRTSTLSPCMVRTRASQLALTRCAPAAWLVLWWACVTRWRRCAAKPWLRCKQRACRCGALRGACGVGTCARTRSHGISPRVRPQVDVPEAGADVPAAAALAACQRANEALLHRAATGQPFSVWKYAMTLDGKIATRSGHSAWVSGESTGESFSPDDHAC
jgi:hypothetical protein